MIETSGHVKILLIENRCPDTACLKKALSEITDFAFDVDCLEEIKTEGECIYKADEIIFNLALDDRHFSLLHTLREQNPNTPIVVLIAPGEEAIGERALLNGAQDYLIKTEPERRIISRVVRYAIERKRIENLARKKESYYRAIIENQIDLLCRFLPDGTITFVNEAFSHNFKKEPDDFLGKNLFQFILEEDAAKVKDNIAGLNKASPLVMFEQRIRDADGYVRWQHWSFRALFNEMGEIIKIQGFGRDITSQKQIEAELQSYRGHLEELVKERTAALEGEIIGRKKIQDDMLILKQQIEFTLGATKTGLDIIDADLNVLYVDPEWAKIYGDYRGKKCYEYFMGTGQACPYCGVVQAIEKKVPVVTEEILVKENNRPIEVTTIPFQSSDGTWMVAEVNVDISRRKSAEGELRKIQMQQKAILDNIPDVAWLKDKESRYIAVNEPFARACGFKPEDLAGKTDLDIWPEELARSYRADDQEVMLSGRRKRKEEPMADKEGKVLWVESVKTPIYNDWGEVIGTTGIARDITARRNSDAELKKYKEHLEELVKERTAELQGEYQERRHIEEALKQSERFLSSVFSSIQDGISVLDCGLNIIQVNPTMEKWYGHVMPVVGRKCYQAYHGRNSPCETCPTVKALETKQPAYEVVPKRGQNSEITGWLDLYAFPLFDKDTGQLKGVIEYVRDITAHKQAQEQSKKLDEELLESNKRFKQMSLLDAHTGLYNHRYLEDVIEVEFHRARRYFHPLSLIFVDIDYFKSINDVYGHKFGDVVLKQLASHLKRVLRRYDIVARFGGEEFVIISPGTARPAAFNLAQRLLDAINLINFGDQKHTVKLKLSLAVSSYPEDRIIKGMDLIILAEEIIEKAKERGGNRVYTTLDLKKKDAPDKGKERLKVDLLKSKIEKLTARTNQNLIEAIFAFSKTIELKDHYTGEHVERTVKYATDIARRLNLNQEEVEMVRQSAMLHDLGKIGVSENILLKKAKLTAREFEQIKKHPQIGADIIRPIQLLHGIIPMIFYHHERWDGKGYLTGLKGEDIPLGARIIAIADVYQALTSDRPYRKAYPRKQAIEIMREGAGTQFDPRIMHTFLAILDKER